MSKKKSLYRCAECASEFLKWSGQCGHCFAWNSLSEEIALSKMPQRSMGYAGVQPGVVTALASVKDHPQIRIPTTLSEFDRVLGGGLVPGSVVLIGGDPGVGKSTVLLQILAHLSKQYKSLYVTGEESLQQVSLRAKRLGLPTEHLLMLTETHVERIIGKAEATQPQLMVIDSIQTVYSEHFNSAPGGVSQVRECAAKLVQFAKQTQTILFLVGHVTKEGMLAGPRVLEHMVDTVLYFEGQTDNRYRMIRAVKNRFGAVNELGIFAMTDKGLREVNNPSAIFLSGYQSGVAGSSVMVAFEGSRPLLVEVQALVDSSQLGNPRRVAVGIDNNRLAMLLAVLNKHANITTHNHDVFINAVGGVKLTETAADLAILLATLSSLRNQPLEALCVFGEVGLSGEIRPVQSGQERLKEAAKHGFKQAIVPKANCHAKAIGDLIVHPVSHLQEVLTLPSKLCNV